MIALSMLGRFSSGTESIPSRPT